MPKTTNEAVKAASQWEERWISFGLSRTWAASPKAKLCNEMVKAMQWGSQSYVMTWSKATNDRLKDHQWQTPLFPSNLHFSGKKWLFFIKNGWKIPKIENLPNTLVWQMGQLDTTFLRPTLFENSRIDWLSISYILYLIYINNYN